MGRFFKNRFIRNLFLTWFTVVMVLMTIFYAVLLWQVKCGLEKNAAEKARQAALILDEKFDAISRVANYIGKSGWYPYMASSSEILNDRVDYTRKKDIGKEMGSYNDVLQVVQSVALLLPKRNVAIDRQSFWEIDRYFSSVKRKDITLETLMEGIEDGYSGLTLFSGIDEDFYAVRRIEYTSDRGLLFVLVNERQLGQYIRTNIPFVLGVEILQEKSIFRWQTEQSDTERIVIESGNYPWSYGLWLEAEGILSALMNPAVAFFLYLEILLLVAGFAWLVSMLTYRPIVALCERLDILPGKDPYDLEAVFTDLKSQKETMEALGNQYYQIGKTSFGRNLLLGTCDRAQAEDLAAKFHSDFTADRFYMVMLLVYTAQNPDQEREMDELLLKFQLGCYRNRVDALGCEIDEAHALIMADRKEGAALQGLKAYIWAMLDDANPSVETAVYEGGIYKGFGGISRSFEDARERRSQGRTEEDEGDLGSRLVAYVREHFTQSELSQQDIADLFGVSRPTVSKVFKKTVDMNFIDYLHMLRVDRAKEMIKGGEKNAQTLMESCGYDNEVTMKRAFVKYAGMTLREYIKMYRQ